jgi:hypothetical protein
MKNLFLRFIKWLLASADTNTKGAAARKLTALSLTIPIFIFNTIYCYHSYKSFEFWKFSQWETWLIINLVAVAFFLGLVTVANLIILKNGYKKDDTQNKTDDEKHIQ